MPDIVHLSRLLQEILAVYLPKLSEDEPAPEPPDLATHFHSVLGCWLRDHLSPLVREVGMFLVYPYPEVEAGAGESPWEPESKECRR